mmetsp:Transcript_9374/g.24239  ORF Transcript_9374/g.24239 Transcript_9374/m.24239 type:complete len:291 (+) Transcript_9374:413-1285(+)
MVAGALRPAILAAMAAGMLGHHRAAEGDALPRQVRRLVAPAQLEAAVPADGHTLAHAAEPARRAGRWLPVALGHGASGGRDLQSIKLLLELVPGLRHVVPVDDRLVRSERPSVVLRVLGEGHCEVTEGADVNRAVLLDKVAQVALAAGQQVRGNLLDQTQQVSEDVGLLAVLAAVHHERDDLGVVDVRRGILRPAGGVAVPAAGRQRLRSERLHELDGDTLLFQLLHEVRVRGASRLVVRERLLLPRRARVYVDEAMVEVIFFLGLPPVHAIVLPQRFRLLHVHITEVQL